MIKARNALGEFRRRYQRYVNRCVRRARSHFLCLACAEEVVDGVFTAVWEQARSFKHDPANNEKAEHRRICVWLGLPICKNLIRKANDKELLVCAMRRNEGEYELAVSERAYEEFVRRHKKRLRWKCSQFTSGVLSEMEVEELVQETFLRAWQKVDIYTDGGTSDRASLQRRTDAWLYAIAYRLFLTWRRDRKDVETVAYDNEEKLDQHNTEKGWRQFFLEPEEDGSPSQNELCVALEELAVEFTKDALLTVLTDGERRILQTDEQEFPSKKERRAALKDLEASLKITPATRRQRLKRARAKIQKYVLARLKEYLRGLEPPSPADGQ